MGNSDEVSTLRADEPSDFNISNTSQCWVYYDPVRFSGPRLQRDLFSHDKLIVKQRKLETNSN